MPDCESRTQRKKRIDMASERPRLPISLIRLMPRRSRTGKPRGVQEIDSQVQEGLDQVRDRVHRVAVVAVQRDDEVAGGLGESAFVAAAISADLFAHHLGAQRGGHFAGAVGGVVVDNDHLIHEFRHRAEHLFDALLLVQAGDDDGDAERLIHGSVFFPTAARLVIMGSMKRLALLFSCSAALVCATDLASVHTVYLLKMSRGLDQFLASRLTEDHVFQVVTDPKQADAVFTDQIGEGFETKLEELFPPPETAKPAPPPKAGERPRTRRTRCWATP